jgi:hypothetical protein
MISLSLPLSPSWGTLRELKKACRDHLKFLQKSKFPCSTIDFITARVDNTNLMAQKEEISARWPVPPSLETKLRALSDFREATGNDALRELTCAVCSEASTSDNMHSEPVPLPLFNTNVLRTPLPPNVEVPFQDDDELRGMVLDVSGVIRADDGHAQLMMCKGCYRSLVVSKAIPKWAIANEQFLGDIPPELKELTVVEEAMIARQRAKCWIIHLKDDAGSGDARTSQPQTRPSNPTLQRGVRGHIIIYPTNPKKLATLLPPALSEVANPICVLFVGNKPPTQEWLRSKAKPLIVRPKKVRDALIWLKENNPLYSDIEIKDRLLDTMPDESILPVTIDVVPPNRAEDAQGARYDATQSCPCPLNQCICNDVSENAFQKYIVSDLDGKSVSSARKSAAALAHLRKGGHTLNLQHGALPTNEYEDTSLFPLLYPTLFPYGSGGFEPVQSGRRVSRSMREQAKHYFNLSDRRRIPRALLVSIFRIQYTAKACRKLLF